MEETFSLFWGGPYSQWADYPIKFNGMEFNCNEQMMMYGKAITFEDTERAKEVMETPVPSEQKALGRRVRNFNMARWDLICWQIVYAANFCKFTQNPECYVYLMDDPADLMVEASPYDKVWGIGLAEDDPRAKIRSEWQGENRLGQVITEVREYIHDPALMQVSHDNRIRDTYTLFNRYGINF